MTDSNGGPLRVSLGAGDRWHGPFGDELRSLISDNLARFERRPIRLTAHRRRAAVAVVLLDADTNPAVLMIKRGDSGRHAGQWAFPGGAEMLEYRLRHDMVVHAPTGAILWQFAEVAQQGRATRVAGLRQPAFALQ